MKAIYRNITAITVVCNTPLLIQRMYKAFRKYHSLMKMIIVDCSDKGNACQKVLNTICCEETTVYRANKNIGHAKGLNFGISKSTTPYVLIMDSDTEMIKSPVKEMFSLIGNNYGVGWITEVGKDGYDFGTWAYHKTPVKYLHPYFALINLEEFYKHPPFVHHGAPAYKAMLDLHLKKQSYKLINFPGLTGHTNGIGANWKSQPAEYVIHDFGGTREQLRKEGREEIEGKWEF